MKVNLTIVFILLAAGVIGLGVFARKSQPKLYAVEPAANQTTNALLISVPAQAVATAVSVPTVASTQSSVTASKGSLRERVLDASLPLAERLAAADERAVRSRALMVTNAAQVLAEAVSFAEYAALPEALRARVERPFSLAAEWRALPVCGSDSPHPSDVPDMVYEVVLSSNYFKAYPVGARTGMGSKKLAAVQGVILGDLAAVRGEAMQVLREADVAAARDLFGMTVANSDPARDFFTDEPIAGVPVTVAAGGRLFLFAQAANVERLNQELAAMEAKPGPKTSATPLLLSWSANSVSGGGFSLPQAWAATDLEASVWTETMKRVYVIRVDFSDNPGASVSQATATTIFNMTVSNQLWQMSYGKTAVNADVSPMVVRLPLPTTSYLPEQNSLLHDQAKAAFNALGTGVNLGNYDIVVVAFNNIGMSSGGLGYAGLAGGSTTWLQGWSTDLASAQVITHELGHNYGLLHAKFWNTTDGSVVGTGTADEYGDFFDIMGYGSVPAGHFHPQGKSYLNWLTTAQWNSVTGSGTFRVWRIDDVATTAANRRAIRIPRAVANDFYWVGYRRAFTTNPYLSGGAYVIWQKPGDIFSHLLDTTPGTALGRDDGAIAIGRTYSDFTANVHITSTAQGGSGANEWLDVRVMRGPFPGNRAPNVTLNGPTNVSARTPITFTVTGSDPDGDPLAYYWDAGNGATSSNQPSITLRWHVGGSHQVKVIVSDLKGLTTTRTLNVTVADPLDNWSTGNLSPAQSMKTISYLRGRFVAMGNAASFLSFDGIDWQATTFADPNFQPAGVAESGGNFIVVGQTYDFGSAAWIGAAYCSPDGRGWSPSALPPATASLNSIAFGSGVWVAVGAAGEVVRSVNGGTNWTSVNAPNLPSSLTNALTGVAYGNGRFVAVGGLTVWISIDGLAWTDRSANNGLEGWRELRDVTFWNGQFYAGGLFSGLRSSANGETWRQATQPNDFNFYDLHSVVGGDGWVMAVGTVVDGLDTPAMLVSADGLVVQAVNSAPSLTDVAWGAGRVVGVSGTGVTKRTGPFYPTNQAPLVTMTVPTNGVARDILGFAAAAFDPNGDAVRCVWHFGAGHPLVEGTNVIFGWPTGGTYSVTLYATDERGGLTTSTHTVVISDPLNTWVARDVGTAAALYDICTGTNSAGLPLAVAVGGEGGTICQSTNGTDWTTTSVGFPNTYLYGVAHDGTNFIAAGQSYFFGGTNAWVGCLWTSPDATAWTCRLTWGTNFAFRDVATGINGIVAVGDGGVMMRSVDRGTNWLQVPSGVTNHLRGVAWGDGGFVAVGGNPLVVLTSADGVMWVNHSAGAGAGGSSASFATVQYCNDRFLASGPATELRYSTNGGVSFVSAHSSAEFLPVLAAGAGLYFAAGTDQQNGGADFNLISTDAQTWHSLPTAAQPDRRAATFFNRTFLTVGDNGSIWQSGAIPAPLTGWPLYRQQQWPGLFAGSEFGADSDLDGQANGLEYALGSDPKSSVSRAIISGAVVGGYLTLNAVRTVIQPDLVYQIERSTDLVNWTTNAVVPLTNTAAQFTGRSAFTGLPVEFLRLRVGLP